MGAGKAFNFDDFGVISDPNNETLTMAQADPTLKTGFGPYEHIREGGDVTPTLEQGATVAPGKLSPQSFPDTSDVPFYRKTANTTLTTGDTASINRRERGRVQLHEANHAILAPIDAAKKEAFPKLATIDSTNAAYDRFGKKRVDEARAAVASEKASMAEYGVPMIKAKATGGDIKEAMEAHQDSLDALSIKNQAKPKRRK